MNGIKLLWLSAALLLMSGSASADLFSDPDMAMDAGSFSQALSTFTGFDPAQFNGGGYLDLFNDTGHVLTSFGLTAFINPGLTGLTFGENQLGDTFDCSTGPNPFFTNCSITYDPTTGQLTTLFYGTSSGPNGPHGIPTLLPGCGTLNGNDPGCEGPGHFSISFNDDFVFNHSAQPSGGWSPSANPGLFSTDPVFQLATPEASGALLFATALVLMAGVRWYARRKRPQSGV